MEIRRGFYDLCVPFNQNEMEFEATLNELYNVGYRTIAVEQKFDHTKIKRKTNEIFPEPIDLSTMRAKFNKKLSILNRLTIVYAAQVINHDMNISLNLKKFHLIAGLPTNEVAMQHACSTFPGELISLVLDDVKHSLIGHKYFQMAARRGIFFELQYAPAIRDSNCRKDVITIAQNLVSHRKAKHIVISSGATNSFEVRSPYDISNLGLIFGMSEEQAKSSVLHVCRTVLIKSEGRRYGKTVVFARNIDTNDSCSDEESDESEIELDYDVEHPTKKQKIS